MDRGTSSSCAELRDPRFAELDVAIEAEDATTTPSGRAGRKQRPRRRQTGKKADCAALSQGKELVTRLAEITLGEFGELLTPLELSKLGRTFAALVTPKKKAGRPRLIMVTRAYEACAAGVPRDSQKRRPALGLLFRTVNWAVS